MVKKTIKKTGLKNYSDAELETELLGRYGELEQYEYDESLERKIFLDLKKVDGFTDYLKVVIAKDILRYFNAIDDVTRHLTRGAYSRTLYLKNRIIKSEIKAPVKKTEDLDLKRYAK